MSEPDASLAAMARKMLRGIELRYLLTLMLTEEGAMTVSDMCFEVEQRGFDVRGRPSKAVSDALRWEVRLGRVIQVERGVYRYGDVPRSTEYRMRRRVAEINRQASLLADDPGTSDDPWQDHLNRLL